MIWNRESLHEVIRERLKGRHLVVVSNREPYLHDYRGGRIECIRPASGLVTALDAVMQACRGTWIAYGSGSADRDTSDSRGKVMVPDGENGYCLKRVWLTKEQEKKYYYGFSNETLWPLSIIAYVRPTFRSEEWEAYREVNEIFARAVLDEIEGKRAFVWFQDYHLALAPKMVKKARPDALLAHFWHIPWPSPDMFRICPWKQEILEGLLGNDLLGFHIKYHCDSFLGCVDRELEALIEREHSSIVYSGSIEKNRTVVRPFPISVDYEAINGDVEAEDVKEYSESLVREMGLHGKIVASGVERIDYAKGIPERLRAIDLFLERNPSYHGRIVFLEMGVISRIQIAAYKNLNDLMTNLVTEINYKYAAGGWSPIIMMKKYHSYRELLGFYRITDLMIVSSLHDGMNLVAKEYVSARRNLSGALILSKFTGATRELASAFQINPYDLDGFARTIKDAIEAGKDEKKNRMKKMRAEVRENNIYRWAGKILQSLSKLE